MIDVTSLPLFNNWQLCNYKKKSVRKNKKQQQLSATEISQETTLYLNTNISTPTLNSATHVHVLIQAPYYFFLFFFNFPGKRELNRKQVIVGQNERLSRR